MSHYDNLTNTITNYLNTKQINTFNHKQNLILIG
jgi:hypothetical protein